MLSKWGSYEIENGDSAVENQRTHNYAIVRKDLRDVNQSGQPHSYAREVIKRKNFQNKDKQ